jgi:hypothetical protein
MSSSKLDTSGVFDSLKAPSSQTQLSLPPSAIRIHRGGIEFRTAKPFPAWKEMTVEMQSPGEPRKVRFTGVVVACNGNKHTGYLVSLAFTSVSRQSQERLNHIAFSSRV